MRIAFWIAFGLIVTAVVLPFYQWHNRLSHWPHVPSPELFVTVQPKEADVVGLYELTSQTVTANGLAAMGGKACRLELRADGTFSVTNYPTWAGIESTAPTNTEFVSTTGRWKLDGTSLSGNGQSNWGIRFSEATHGIGPLELRSKGAPYDLMEVYGDYDEARVVMFGKVK